MLVLLLAALALPAVAAGTQLEPGTIVAGDGPGPALLVLLHVQGGYGDAQSVYVVQPVARCGDPGGAGWHALPSFHGTRSAPELETREVLASLCPCRLPLPEACANPVGSDERPVSVTGWDRLADGSLDLLGGVTFEPFGRM